MGFCPTRETTYPKVGTTKTLKELTKNTKPKLLKYILLFGLLFKRKLGLSQIAWLRQNFFLQIPLVAVPLNEKQLRIGYLCVRRDMLDYKGRCQKKTGLCGENPKLGGGV